MIDPLSIAGLTISIFDQLLKLGERTAQLIADAKTFDDDTDALYDKLKDENNRSRQLRHLLFESSPIYGGQALFEKFDEDVQDQIKIFLGRLVSILHEGYELLHRRYGTTGTIIRSPSPQSSISDLSISQKSSSTLDLLKTFPKSSMMVIRWSLRDKKRTEEVLNNFADLNSRIHENIKLWSLATSIGLDIQHLERLKNDKYSIDLGFNVDATLQIAAGDAQSIDGTLELGEQDWTNAINSSKPVEERFGLMQLNGMRFLQENRSYDEHRHGSSSTEVDPRTRDRVDGLAKLLQHPKERVFCIPRCVGWKYVPSARRIAFAFEIPADITTEPVSLRRLLDGTEKPELGDKFQLAFGLARCIAQLQMVKWVHESFRSENILFFPPEKDKDAKSMKMSASTIDYSQPWVLGFEYSRPESDFSLGITDVCLARDIYRHPVRQGQPGMMFNKIHDIYALGVVLLEIGLWEPAITLEKNQFKHARDPYVIQAQLQKQTARRLGSRMGERYKQVVLKCLSGDFGVVDDTKEDLKLQQGFRTQVVDVLERASANV
ncbi:uncharacterized protein BP5553_08839 [Venustampulla echinocandica]|uniref:DUF7580 domain-containing protein n=1 Tax=Venustampulla echinocandica TaxID=2656787 RepID=A0A370TD41_9HELO|nr:uncharacterized protein BP5553_08839 [Venustampulla echinocandica]RDL32383.1 hypothetical protein BP5553_08839 [Venustampulla echinocandica]